MLAQTFEDFEIIVSDNASTDGTAAIVERYAERDSRVRLLRQPQNVGAARNYNYTVELAKGEYFKWAAHDDLCAPTFLERCVGVLDSRPEVATCYTRTQYVDGERKPLHTSNGGSSRRIPIRPNACATSSRRRSRVTTCFNRCSDCSGSMRYATRR